jgi:hypothetical protein
MHIVCWIDYLSSMCSYIFNSPGLTCFELTVQDKKLKARFSAIPTPDELSALGPECVRADAVLVDAEKDKRVAKLKQFTIALVKGLTSNPASMIKKIAEVVRYSTFVKTQVLFS